MVKYTESAVELIPQFDISTSRGRFRLDFVLQLEMHRVAIECDGKEFHDSWRDEWRDAITVGEGHVDIIYRLRGHDITYNIAESLFLIAHWEPTFFTAASRMNLTSLVYSKNIRKLAESPREYVSDFVCDDEGHTHGPRQECRKILLQRRTKEDRFMRNYFQRSQALGPGDLDKTIAAATNGRRYLSMDPGNDPAT